MTTYEIDLTIKDVRLEKIEKLDVCDDLIAAFHQEDDTEDADCLRCMADAVTKKVDCLLIN